MAEAVLAQLNAEITAHKHTVKSLAALIGIDYNTFRRYANGERAMPLPVFWAAIEALEIPDEVFVRRARTRRDDA